MGAEKIFECLVHGAVGLREQMRLRRVLRRCYDVRSKG
jgi:hypothetical protein